MKNQLRRFWFDESGAIESMSWLLLTCVIALGGVVGLASVRDQVVQQFGDLSLSLEHLDQSYSYSCVGPDGSETSTFYNDETPTPDEDSLAPAGLEMGVEIGNRSRSH